MCVCLTQQPPLHSGPIVQRCPLYNTSTLLRAAFTPVTFLLQSLPILPTDTFMHTHTHQTDPCSFFFFWFFIMGRDHSFFPGRKTCSEVCSSEPRALAAADRDAAVNLNRVPLVLKHPAVVSPAQMEIAPRCLHALKCFGALANRGIDFLPFPSADIFISEATQNAPRALAEHGTLYFLLPL